MIRQSRLLVMFVLLIGLFTGCASFSTFQTPTPLKEGEAMFGMGVSGFVSPDGSAFGITDIYGRMGISDRMDVGIKAFGIPLGFLGGIMLDGKYAIATGSPTVAFDFGVSYFGIEDSRLTGLYPSLLFGSDRFFVGAKLVYLYASQGVELFNAETVSQGQVIPGGMIGLALGKKNKMMLEVNFYRFPEGDLVLFPGIGFQLRFK
ncbi:MAG: hypothetical protein Q9P90_00960 [candidate division KSB1 bacterium]|nr:hypothetical protein [candidate division KSB1 bacterium]